MGATNTSIRPGLIIYRPTISSTPKERKNKRGVQSPVINLEKYLHADTAKLSQDTTKLVLRVLRPYRHHGRLSVYA